MAGEQWNPTRVNFSGTNQAMANAQRSISDARDSFGNISKRISEEEKRKELLAQRALENQRANDRLSLEKAQDQRAEETAKRNKAIHDAGLAKKEAIAEVDKNSSNYTYRTGEGVTPVLDKKVIDTFGWKEGDGLNEDKRVFDPSSDPSTWQDTGPLSPEDAKLANQHRRLQEQYEAIKTSREDAIARYSKALVDAGEDPDKAKAKAAIVMSGLTSDKETITAANASAQAQTEMNKWLAEQRNKAALADTKAKATIAKAYTKDGKGSAGSEKKAMENITKMISGLDTGTFGWGDNKTDAIELVEYYRNEKKVPVSVINQAMIAATEEGGIFFDKQIDSATMKDYLNRIAVDYSTKNGNSGLPATKVHGYEVVTNPTVAFKEGQAEYDRYKKNLDFLNWDDLPKSKAEIEAQKKRQSIIDAAKKKTDADKAGETDDEKQKLLKEAEAKKTAEEKRIAEKKNENIFNKIPEDNHIVKAYRSNNDTALQNLYEKDKDAFVKSLEGIYNKDETAGNTIAESMGKKDSGVFGESTEKRPAADIHSSINDIVDSDPTSSIARSFTKSMLGDNSFANNKLTDKGTFKLMNTFRSEGLTQNAKGDTNVLQNNISNLKEYAGSYPDDENIQRAVASVVDVEMRSLPKDSPERDLYFKLQNEQEMDAATSVLVSAVLTAVPFPGAGMSGRLAGKVANKNAMTKMLKEAEALRVKNKGAYDAIQNHLRYIEKLQRTGKAPQMF